MRASIANIGPHWDLDPPLPRAFRLHIVKTISCARTRAIPADDWPTVLTDHYRTLPIRGIVRLSLAVRVRRSANSRLCVWAATPLSRNPVDHAACALVTIARGLPAYLHRSAIRRWVVLFSPRMGSRARLGSALTDRLSQRPPARATGATTMRRAHSIARGAYSACTGPAGSARRGTRAFSAWPRISARSRWPHAEGPWAATCVPHRRQADCRRARFLMHLALPHVPCCRPAGVLGIVFRPASAPCGSHRTGLRLAGSSAPMPFGRHAPLLNRPSRASS